VTKQTVATGTAGIASIGMSIGMGIVIQGVISPIVAKFSDEWIQ